MSHPLIPQTLTIASRESALAMWQARHIQAQLQSLYPQCQIHIIGMTTQGDQILDKTLSKIGGKGLFIKELETALQENRADLAVHSIKRRADGFAARLYAGGDWRTRQPV